LKIEPRKKGTIKPQKGIHQKRPRGTIKIGWKGGRDHGLGQ